MNTHKGGPDRPALTRGLSMKCVSRTTHRPSSSLRNSKRAIPPLVVMVVALDVLVRVLGRGDSHICQSATILIPVPCGWGFMADYWVHKEHHKLCAYFWGMAKRHSSAQAILMVRSEVLQRGFLIYSSIRNVTSLQWCNYNMIQEPTPEKRYSDTLSSSESPDKSMGPSGQKSASAG
jgi:hypothetical protein